MHRTVLFVLLTLVVAACGASASDGDTVAMIQVDSDHDIVVMRVEEADLTPVLSVCLVAHGEAGPADGAGCAEIDPLQWTRRSIVARLDPGSTTSLIVVVHEQARFDIVQPASLRASQAVQIRLPADPIGALSGLDLEVVVALAELTSDNAIGCLDTGLAGGVNPVFIASSEETSEPADLQTACL